MTPLCADLRPREEELLVLLADGHDLDSASRLMGIAYATAREYSQAARRRLGATTTTQAVVIIVRLRDREPVGA